jgi:hypothetical protein
MADLPPFAARQAAIEYIEHRGWSPVPIPKGSKAPGISRWQNLRLLAADVPDHFSAHVGNIGIIHGEASPEATAREAQHPQHPPQVRIS